MSITLLITDGDLVPIIAIRTFTQVTATLNFNKPDSTQVVLPALAKYIAAAQPGNRLVVIRDGAILTAGPIEVPGAISWSADASSGQGGPGVMTISSTDDSVWLGARRVYPDPTSAWPGQTATAYYEATGVNAEVGMRDLVRLSVGSGALTDRQIPHLALGALVGVGSDVNIRARTDVLSDVLRSTAQSGGGLGFRVVQDGDDLLFQVYQPTDLSGSVRFSRGLGNLRSFTYSPQAPTATVALVGGDGTGTSRTFVERTNTAGVASYGRIETFVSDDSGDTTDLNQAGDNALADAAEQGQLSAQCIDTAQVRAFHEFNLGDRVSVVVADGIEVTDVVCAITVTYANNSELVMTQVGTGSPSSDPKLVRAWRQMDRRIGVEERR